MRRRECDDRSGGAVICGWCDVASSPGMHDSRRWKRQGQGFTQTEAPVTFTETYSILLHMGLVHLCPKRNPPKCDEQKPGVAPAHLVVPADDELQVAHELPEGFVLGEQVLCARGDVLLVLEVQVLDLSQHCHQLRRVKRTEAVRSHGTGLGSICAGLSLGGFCSPQGEPRGRPTWGTGSAGRIRMLPSSSSVHDPLTCPRLSLRYRSPPPHV